MTEFELIEKLAVFKCEMVAPFEVATTKEQWEQLLPGAKLETETEAAKYYLSRLPVFEKKTAKITFPKCDLTDNDLFNAVEELTKGFDKKRCGWLLDTLTKHKERLETVCKQYQTTWGKPAPIVFVCGLLESKLTDEQHTGQQSTAQPDIMTERAKKYFAKAVEAGYMTKTESGCKWIFLNGGRGAKAALAYFIQKVYSPDVTKPQSIPYKALQNLFGVKRLDSAINGLLNVKKEQTWRGDIDSLFDN